MNPIAGNTMQVKQMNRELVRQSLKAMKQATKSDVARATGLSIATCGNILNELSGTGEAVELEVQESKGGRPAQVYKYNVNFAYIACIIVKAGLHSHSMDYTVANLAGEAIAEGREEHLPLDYARIDELIGRLISQYPEIQAVGIGVPGAVDQGVMNLGDIEELVDVELEALIRGKYGLKVILENDMNLTVYGFYHRQEYAEEKSVAVATFIEGSFPGAGLMVNGHIHRGSTCFAGEIAFLPFGMPRDELYRRLHDRKMFPGVAAHAVTSLTAVMNPETVALTGSLVQPDDLALIRRECLNYIPERHLPRLVLLEHPDADYMYGLTTMTLESLAYSYRLVEKRQGF